MTFAEFKDKFAWASFAIAIHPFSWGLEFGKDVRDKSAHLTFGPFTFGANW